MADDRSPPSELIPPSSSPESSLCAPGAFFPNAHNFTIAGGHFTSITHSAPTIPSDFRTIPLGDLDLRSEIRLDDFGVVNRQHGLGTARRIYSARVDGRQSDMTVAVYQGGNAEETWQRELAKYSGLRHPNILQLYGVVNSGGIYATIFHDDLVPVEQFVDEYRHSVISTAYLYGYFTREFEDAQAYFQSLFGSSYWLRYESRSWIRRSTGRLCVEVAPNSPDNSIGYILSGSLTQPGMTIHSLGPDREKRIISALTLNQFHEVCYWYLPTLSIHIIHAKVQLGAIVLLYGESIQEEVAHIPNLTFTDDDWNVLYHRITPTDMENGWRRFPSSCVNESQTVYRTMRIRYEDLWLSQANHVFSQLPTAQNLGDYILISGIGYWLRFSTTSNNLVPEGYLFLCPMEDLRSENGTWLQYPECPAYWSLDHSGNTRLSSEEASRLGFPSLQFEMEVEAKSWHTSVYEALGCFHSGKGFDPNSQDIARHLEHQIYVLSCPPNIDSARSEQQCYLYVSSGSKVQ
ncbi:hypothetical protein C8R44DRAFT_718234 [Mycena epipterygia]|nr:hypothetical protein C8R44DRAFT_718234 [Mycena epipterygia]